MNTVLRIATRRLIIALCWLTYSLLAMDVISVFIPANHYGQDFGSKWTPHGELRHSPVIYRVLMPQITLTIQAIMPESVRRASSPYLIAFRDNPVNRKWLGIGDEIPEPLNDYRIVDTCIYMIVQYIALLAAMGMLYALASSVFKQSLAYRLLAPLIALLLIEPISAHLAFSYDFAEIFFASACLCALHRQSWGLYLLYLSVGICNKETIVCVSVFYFIHFYRKVPLVQYVKLGVGQLVLALWIEGLIRYNTVHTLFSYAMQADVWTDGRSGHSWWFESLMFMRAHDYTVFIHIMVTFVFITFRWMEKPAFLRDGMWIVFINVALFVSICNPGEYRDLYTCLPILVLLATHTLVRISGADRLWLFQPVTVS